MVGSLSAIKCLVQAIKCQKHNMTKRLYLYAGAGLGKFYAEVGQVEGGSISVNVLAHDWPSPMGHDLCCLAGLRPSSP